MFNISEIIHTQIPDDEGNIIPATVQDGSAEIAGSHGENEHMSRRYAGIHFKAADLAGRHLGRVVADNAWQKAQRYFDGTAKGNVVVGPS